MRTMCPYCKQEFEVEENFLNQSVECTNCSRTFIVQEIKVCARCGTANPHSAIICRKCHLDLTTTSAFRSAASAGNQKAEEPEEEKPTFADRWAAIKEPLMTYLRPALKLLIVAAIAAGGYFGYKYYTRRKSEKRQEELKKHVGERLVELDSELKKTKLAAGLDYEAEVIYRELIKRGKNPDDDYNGGYNNRNINYRALAGTAYRQRLLEGYGTRLKNIDNFINKYDGIMIPAGLPGLSDGVKQELRQLVLISRTDAETVLNLKHFSQIIQDDETPEKIADEMNTSLPAATKEKLLIIFLTPNKSWKKISRDVEKIMEDENFPQQFLSAEEIGNFDRQAAKNCDGDDAKKEQIKKQLMMDHLGQLWRRKLAKLKSDEYNVSIRYYRVYRDVLEGGKGRVLTAVINENLANFSWDNFPGLEAAYKNPPESFSEEKKQEVKENYDRVFEYAKTSACKIEVPSYSSNHFREWHELSYRLCEFGLKPEYAPANWQEAFPPTDIKVALGNSEQIKKFNRDLDSYIKRNNMDFANKFVRKLSAAEVLAEIERVDGILKELEKKIKDPESSNIEVLSGVFLYPEKEKSDQ